MNRKDLLRLSELSTEEIDEILTLGLTMKERLRNNQKTLTDLAGKSVTTLFYENSTRTRCSFELAAKYLGAHVVNIAVQTPGQPFPAFVINCTYLGCQNHYFFTD